MRTSDEDTIAIANDAVTLPSIVKLMADPMQSKEVMTSCLSVVAEMSATSEVVDTVASSGVLPLTLQYLDSNAVDLPKPVRAALIHLLLFARLMSN